MYLNYFADSGTFWNIIRLLQNTCCKVLVHIYKFPVQWPLLQCLGDLFDLVTSPGMTEYHSSGCPHAKDMMWHTEHGVATRPLSTFKQLLALTEKCIFRGEKETFRDWINHNWLNGILMVPDNSVYVSWTNPRPGLRNRFSDFVKN